MRIVNLGILLVLIPLFGCKSQPGPDQYFYENFGRRWTKYVPPHDSLEHFQISPDGQQVSYLIKCRGRWLVGINGRHYANFQGTYRPEESDQPLTLTSNDSLHTAAIYKREPSFRPAPASSRSDARVHVSKWFLEIDRHIFGGYDGDFRPRVQFSRDGKVFGFLFKQGGQYYVQIMETTFGPYYRADFTITQDNEVVIAYIEGRYVHVERMEGVK